MVNFIQALNEGIDAAKLMEQNRKEIRAVFQDLNQQLKQALQGRVEVLIKSYKPPREKPNPITVDTSQLIAETFNFPLPDKIAIFAHNPLLDNSPEELLANWKEHSSGYPCTLGFGGQEIICEDKESLEEGLAEMLKDPKVGEKIFKLMHLSDANKSISA